MNNAQNKAERIWQTACKVPRGKVASYGLVADLAGLPGRARMVGRALGSAPAEIQVPWHRILRSNGQIAFPGGTAKANQQKGLLQEEGVVVVNYRVDLKRYLWKPDLGELLQLDY